MTLRAKLLIALWLVWAPPSYADSENSNKDHPKHENGSGDGIGKANGNGAASMSDQLGSDQTTAQGVARPVVNVPLNLVVAQAEAASGGRAIDAKLIRVGKALFYQITVLTDQGVSRRLYYDALSGRSARAP